MRSCEEQKKNGEKGDREDVSHFCLLSTPALQTRLPSKLSKSTGRGKRIPPIYICFPSARLNLSQIKRWDWLLLARRVTTGAVVSAQIQRGTRAPLKHVTS